MSGKAEILCKDYRDIPQKIWKKISCIEMIEHVGVKNYGTFLKQVHNLLDDDGLFFVQVCRCLLTNHHWV
jgi:cyclopropane fatty-acyl-phospholipid synthase-like methyltransferase